MRILITGACGVTPRAIARSLQMSERLGEASLIGTDRGGNWYGFYEGRYDRVYLIPGTRDPGYPEAIADVCAKEAIDAAVVSPEAEVLYWSARELPVPALLPSPRFVAVAISKKLLYDALKDSGLIPPYRTVSRDELMAGRGLEFRDGQPVWLRDFSDASSSGLGAIKVTDPEQAHAWACLNPDIDSYLVAGFLPGRNLACCLLFADDELLKVACYERLDYFQGHLVVSGITGNISRGKLVNEPAARAAAEQAIRRISAQHGEPAHGLFTVDLKEAEDGSPKVTEINVRHTAGTSSLAAGGANMAEAQVLATLDRREEIGEVEVNFGPESTILRDIDGPPLLVGGDPRPALGGFVERAAGR